MSGHLWRRALVTGGAGFVGSHLCGHLLAAGSDVVCGAVLALRSVTVSWYCVSGCPPVLAGAPQPRTT